VQCLCAMFVVPSLLAGARDGQENQTNAADQAAVGKAVATSSGLHGYIGFSASRPPTKSEYSAGMGFYSAVWPLIDQPLADFQIGLAGCWITPRAAATKPTGRAASSRMRACPARVKPTRGHNARWTSGCSRHCAGLWAR